MGLHLLPGDLQLPLASPVLHPGDVRRRLPSGNAHQLHLLPCHHLYFHFVYCLSPPFFIFCCHHLFYFLNFFAINFLFFATIFFYTFCHHLFYFLYFCATTFLFF